MRIAYLVNQYPHPSHGFIRREILALEAAGHEVARITVRPSDAPLVSASDLAERECTAVLLASGPRLLAATAATAFRRPLRLARALGLALRVAARAPARTLQHLAYVAEACLLHRWLRAQRSAHLHAHFGTNPAMVALLCRRLGGPPYSFTVHGPEEFDAPHALALREKAAEAAFVVAVCSYGRGQLLRWARPEDWARIHVVRCGLDDAFLAAAPVPPQGSRQLVCVGRLCPQKGQLLLLEAARDLARRGTQFTLVFLGGGELQPVLREHIRAAGLEDRVTLAGWQDEESVKRFLEGSRALVLPSLAEGLPVALMEALARGIPVVTTFVAGIPELVDATCGVLVPAGSAEHLAGALQEVLDASPAQREAWGRAGAARVRERHSAAREATRLALLMDGARP